MISSLSVAYTKFIDLHTSFVGGAIYAQSSGFVLTVEKCMFYNCIANSYTKSHGRADPVPMSGGAIFFEGAGNSLLFTAFRSCSGSDYGQAAFIYNPGNKMCLIDCCSAESCKTSNPQGGSDIQIDYSGVLYTNGNSSNSISNQYHVALTFSYNLENASVRFYTLSHCSGQILFHGGFYSTGTSSSHIIFNNNSITTGLIDVWNENHDIYYATMVGNKGPIGSSRCAAFRLFNCICDTAYSGVQVPTFSSTFNYLEATIPVFTNMCFVSQQTIDIRRSPKIDQLTMVLLLYIQ